MPPPQHHATNKHTSCHRPSRTPVQPNNRGLLCGVLNVNNMPKAGLKLVEVHHLLKEPRCDIMGFVETKEA
jgi:hypothetical protein